MKVSFEQLCLEIARSYEIHKNWRTVASKYGITPPMAWRIVKQKYEPKRPPIRRVLGLPDLKPAPICPDCQEVPLSKRHRCPARANSQPRRQPPIRVAPLTEAERVAVLAQTPAERKRRLLDEMPEWF